jgi:sugar lactone lactonase YvrE
LAQPVGVAFDSKGNLFVANEQNNTIQEFNPLGVGTLFVHSGLNAPTALAFDSAGNLYVANANANNIKKFNSSGVGTVFASSGVSSPTGMAFDSGGNLFVADQNGIIEKFNSSGVGTVFARLQLGITPVCVAFDSTGVLFATTSADTIEKFNSAGAGTVFANSGLAVPNGLAFEPAPVPEPSAWALLLCAPCALLAGRLGLRSRAFGVARGIRAPAGVPGERRLRIGSPGPPVHGFHL